MENSVCTYTWPRFRSPSEPTLQPYTLLADVFRVVSGAFHTSQPWQGLRSRQRVLTDVLKQGIGVDLLLAALASPHAPEAAEDSLHRLLLEITFRRGALHGGGAVLRLDPSGRRGRLLRRAARLWLPGTGLPLPVGR